MHSVSCIVIGLSFLMTFTRCSPCQSTVTESGSIRFTLRVKRRSSFSKCTQRSVTLYDRSKKRLKSLLAFGPVRAYSPQLVDQGSRGGWRWLSAQPNGRSMFFTR